MPEKLAVAELLAGAARGDQTAWDGLVERYMPLVYSIIRRYRLSDQDGADVSQTLWLRLVEHLSEIREPCALPGWIATTTKHEALRVLTAHRRTAPVDPLVAFESERTEGPEPDEDLLRAERHQALREGLADLAPRDREFILLLVADPPIPYREISRRLGMPVGSIGPTRARCLGRLRATPAIIDFLSTSGTHDTGGDQDDLTKVGRQR
jgi:RNA polymerase sigma factor (sigma-70 family)